MNLRITELINAFDLQAHPEGGFYKETYRSEELLYSPEAENGRNLCTSIYFLLTAGNFSAFHRIDSDELWNFHEGAACLIHILHQDGSYSKLRLGAGTASGETFQALVKAGDWFASETTGDYSLMGCIVAPGFDFNYFELADRNKLLLNFPDHVEIIERFTR